ncbi:hypothetical protein, partial [Maritalea porphyrae]|uniref:hypothetical protein n=1 Tax=Maritalea porphyrae TaxID=880732 RepID=UPI0024E05F99
AAPRRGNKSNRTALVRHEICVAPRERKDFQNSFNMPFDDLRLPSASDWTICNQAKNGDPLFI